MKALVIGLGRIGWQYSKDRGLSMSHVGSLLLNPEIDMVIGVDMSQQRREEVMLWWTKLTDDGTFLKKRLIVEPDYVQPVKEHQPEIAVIAVPTPQHYPVVRDLAHPKGPEVLLVEKPVAESFDVANQLANRCAHILGLTEGRKPRVAVNLSRRWHPAWQKAKELIESGIIGKVEYAVGHHPGALLRSGVHMLDLFNWYFGDVANVRSLAVADSWMQKKYPDTNDRGYDAQITYTNGAVAYFLGAALAETPYQRFDLEVTGSKGAIEVHENGRLLCVKKPYESPEFGGMQGLEVNGSLSNQFEDVDPMAHMVEDLVQCVKNAKQQPKSTLENALNADMAAHLIRQSNFNLITPNDLDIKATVKTI